MQCLKSVCCAQSKTETRLILTMFIDHKNFGYANRNWVRLTSCPRELLSVGGNFEIVSVGSAEGLLVLDLGLKR